MMRKIHLISISDPLIYELAVAIRDRGYEVSVSGEHVPEEMQAVLDEKGIEFFGEGWFPEKLTKETHSVVLGSMVTEDNPELLQAKELGLLVLSIPEFIYQRTRTKIRVVVTGSRGRKAILSMIVAALRKQNLSFDYATTSDVALLDKHLHFSFESRIALIEGDEHITSVLEKRSQLEFYRPHIAVMTNLKWNVSHDHKSPEAFMNTYRYFSTSIEREGKLIYFGGDPNITELVEEIRSDITAIPFEEHPVEPRDGETCLLTRYGDYPVKVLNKYFLVNVNAARLTCRQLGVKDVDFYQAISDFTLSLSK